MNLFPDILSYTCELTLLLGGSGPEMDARHRDFFTHPMSEYKQK